MITTLEASNRNVLSTKNGYTVYRPKTRLFGQLNFGPRFREGFVAVARKHPSEAEGGEFSLYYRVYNPSSIRCADSPPIVVIHGGPSLPSDYLYPLVQQFSTSRTIIFYDQLGCGRSSQPKGRNMYSVENAVNDLKELIHSLKLERFHLLGHSFGGIVAYECAKAEGHQSRGGKCLSLILDSTPSNMRTSFEECSRLEGEVRSELMLEDMNEEEAATLVNDQLRKRSECRLEEMPVPLLAAIESRGTAFGPEEVSDYVAHPPPGDFLPPVLLVRGQYDFVTEKCVEGWREIFNRDSESGTVYREEEMRNCAHYCHLEDAQSFGDLIKSHCFVNDY